MSIVFAAARRNELPAERLETAEQGGGQQAFVSELRQIQAAAGRLLALVEPAMPTGPQALATALGPAASNRGTSASPFGAQASRRPLRARVLVVGDSEINLEPQPRSLRLTGRGYAVAVATDGHEAMRMAQEQGCDTVLLDVVMPDDSLEALQGLPEASSELLNTTTPVAREDLGEALRLGTSARVAEPLVVLARVQTQLALKLQKEKIRKLAEELEVKNRFIQRTFGRYLSQEVVAGLLESPEGLELGGEQRRVTILMSDLRGFTSLSERLGPQQVVRLLNSYLGAMADIIMKHRGTIDEFIGDAILAIFGAPILRADDARRALACALEMQMAVEGLNRRHRKEGLPRLEMGVAVHTGEVVVGNIGSEKRAKYGVVGSPVNQTGRIESFTVGGQILISAATLEEAGPNVAVGERLTLEAKGAAESISLYDLRGIGGEYGLFLPESEGPRMRLAREMPVRCRLLEGKAVGAEAFTGHIVELSVREALMRCPRPLSALSNLKIEVPAAPGLPGGVGYAKVMETPNGPGNLARVCFTSVPPDVEAWLELMLSAVSGERH
jgi:adenylate cyclase